MWVLGMESRSSARAENALNHCTSISPAPLPPSWILVSFTWGARVSEGCLSHPGLAVSRARHLTLRKTEKEAEEEIC